MSGPAAAIDQVGHALLDPASVALVGASDDERSPASRPLRLLRLGGFAGRTYVVNPRRDEVGGQRAHPSLQALPEVPEHVFVLTGADRAVEAVEECAALEVPLVTVLASGFGDGGSAGRQREERLGAVVAGAPRTRLLGPSSIGVVAPRAGLRLTANAAFREPEVPAGSVVAISQSGSMIGALFSRSLRRQRGFAALVSVGSELDVSVGDVGQALMGSEVSSFVLFLETIRHPERFHRFARAAHERGQPIVAHLVGRSDEAAALATTHTGAMVGDFEAMSAFLAECGIAVVQELDSLLDGGPLLERAPSRPSADPAVGVVTTTGGGGAMVVDRLAGAGLRVVAPSAGAVERLDRLGVDAGRSSMVDLTLAGANRETMAAALRMMVDDPGLDHVVVVVGSSARFEPESTVAPIVDVAATSAKVVAVVIPDAPDALHLLRTAGVPCFDRAEACADAMAGLASRRPVRAVLGSVEARSSDPAPVLDEVEAQSLLTRAGVSCVPTVQVEVPPGGVPPAPVHHGLDYPVVVKGAARGLLHKTDVGAVRLGIADQPGVDAAVGEVLRSTAAAVPPVVLTSILVQPQLDSVAELLVGARVDPLVGPVVVVAAGGRLADLFDDHAIRLAPVDRAGAGEMVRELKVARLLAGYRGHGAGDLDAVAEAVVAVSELIGAEGVVEVEVNPLLVHERGATAVDAVVRRGR